MSLSVKVTVADLTEPSGFWAWTHTEMSWLDLDTWKLTDGKSLPLIVKFARLLVPFADTVLTLKHPKSSFKCQQEQL